VAYGCVGASFFSLDAADPAGLLALRQPVQAIAKRTAVPPTLTPGADGDEVVWAQELLNGAGTHLPVGGFFGNQTSLAVAAFQTRHHLRSDGVLDAATWKLLVRQHAREPTWTTPPDSGRLVGAVRDGLDRWLSLPAPPA
jgi:peptidoglycan hydrolase-like protein with peptidoglycan-binding domain